MLGPKIFSLNLTVKYQNIKISYRNINNVFMFWTINLSLTIVPVFNDTDFYHKTFVLYLSETVLINTRKNNRLKDRRKSQKL